MNRSTDLDDDANDPVAPVCRPTVDRLQQVLDGEQPAAVLDTDPHADACPVCQDRIRAARLLLAVLAAPSERLAVPAGLADTVLAGVRVERRAQFRRRVFAVAGGCAVAAAVLIAVWLQWGNPVAAPPNHGGPDMALAPPVPGSPPAAQPEQAPPPRPAVRISNQLAKAGQAFRDSFRTIADPTDSTQEMFPNVAGALSWNSTSPVSVALEPARQSLAEIPGAARAGFEPVTGSAEKAFHRLMRDVGAVQPGSSCQPNS